LVDEARHSLITGARVLVVDDDRAVRTVLEINLGKHGLQVDLANNPREAIAALQQKSYDVVLTDVKMPGATGIELLQRIRRSWPDVQVVVMTGYGSVEDAVAAMKAGAADYVIKPVSKDELLIILERVLENRTLRAELIQLRRDVQARYGFENLIGTTPAMLSLYEDVDAVADTSATVLLQGPTGTGKELLAHALHYRSSRASGPFVRVNCTAIPESLLESELFGHEHGAFTGAIRQHRGKFEQADSGTLFLDEIGEIDLSMQVKLLRVLESGEFQRVGGHDNVKVNVRVVAATNRDLGREVAAGRFREDLFYRLNVVTLRVPPLKERLEDVPLLVDHFLRRVCAKEDRPAPTVPQSNMARLCTYHWPGNVRQLEHTVERAVILHREGGAFEIPLPEDTGPAPAAPAQVDKPLRLKDEGLTAALERHEREMIIEALKASDGVQARAARLLDLSKSNLGYRIRKLGIALTGLDYE
jgi:DNA-binding NtrC family response regulator